MDDNSSLMVVDSSSKVTDGPILLHSLLLISGSAAESTVRLDDSTTADTDFEKVNLAVASKGSVEWQTGNPANPPIFRNGIFVTISGAGAIVMVEYSNLA